jgi:hypothetical protein
MERISIFNYEAFYLDFLEGNLNEADTALFLDFLEANPDLKMDDESIPAFSSHDMILDAKSKQDLKHPSDEVAITELNAEYFIISEAEGLLSEEKTEELSGVVGENANLVRDKEIYSAVYFEPDMSVSFDNKEGLKRKKTVILWPYVTAAAAASVIAFFMVWASFNNSDVKPNDSGFAKRTEKQNTEKSVDQPKIEKGLTDPTVNPQVAIKENSLKNDGTKDKQDLKNTPQNRVKNNTVNRMEKRTAGHLMTSFNNQKPQPITAKVYPIEVQETPVDNSMAYSDMVNPIEPITNFVGKKTNTEVDFRRAKKSEGKPSGFFLKIGKFELSRKKH